MKNIIPLATLCIGMMGAPVYAEDIQKEIPESSEHTLASVIANSTGKKVNKTLGGGDSRMRETWRAYSDQVARDILPGSPMAFNMNGAEGIMYQLNGDRTKYGIKYYGGVIHDTLSGRTEVGVRLTIPVGR